MSLTDLPDHSRIWIYQANRELTDSEVQGLLEEGKLFLEGWSAHGADLVAALEVRYSRFLIIAVDEKVAGATGCSIDKSVHFVESVGAKHKVDFFNRLLIAYKEGKSIETLELSDFQNQLEQGNLNSETCVFNNLVETLGEFRSGWETTVSNSWHKQLL